MEGRELDPCALRLELRKVRRWFSACVAWWCGMVVWCGLQEPTWVPGSASSSSDGLGASGFQSWPGPRDEKPSASLVDLLVRSCAVQLEP